MSGGSAPNPTAGAISGIETGASLYPYQYLVNSLAQTGGVGTVTNPTGNQQTLDFTGLGTADIQNQTQNQMAQALLQIQQQYGDAYIQQALADLKQSDPNGYAAYQQLYQQIQQQQNAPTPNLDLAQGTQADVLNNLQSGQTLNPSEITQVQQGVRGNNLASGVYLGNAPAAAESTALVNAQDQQQSQEQQAAGQYLSQGVSPSDLQYQQLQQDMANYGAFINGQTPTAQFSQIGGASGGAAPYTNTGYQQPTLNEGQLAGQGISNQMGVYNASQQEANPYLAGLNIGLGGISTGINAYTQANQNPYAGSNTMPFSPSNTYWNSATTPAMAPAAEPTIDTSTFA